MMTLMMMMVNIKLYIYSYYYKCLFLYYSEWISEFLKQDEEAVKDTYSEPLPDIITVPESEREYTDLFQRLFVDGISMKSAVLSAILE